MLESHSNAAPQRTGNLIVAVALLVLVAVGGYFRFVGQNWDDFSSLHPDERFLMQVASGIGGPTTLSYSDPAGLTEEQAAQRTLCYQRYPTTSGIGGYFDADCSPWNPQNVGFGTFVYGTLPTFSTRAVAEIMAGLTTDQSWLTFYPIHLAARLVSGVSELLIILVVFSIGLRLHGKWVGLLAAALYTLTVFSIQQAHFGTSDPMANLFTALSILFAVCVQRDGKLRDYVFFGLAFGCALASRINLLPLVGLIFVASAIRLLPVFGRGVAGYEREAHWTQSAVGIILAGVATLVAFRLLNPYAFNGPGIFGLTPNRAWLDEVGKARYFISGDWDAPPNWQWIARPRYLFPLWNMVAYGMGLALGITAVLSTIVALWRLVRGKPGALVNAVPLAWFVAYFGYMGLQWVMTMRYYLPLYPALVVMAAWGLAALVRGPLPGLPQRFIRLPGRTRRTLGWVAIAVVTGFSLLWALMFSGIYRNLSNRVAASYWFWEQVPGDFAMRIDDAPPETPLLNIALPNSFTPGSAYDLVGQATQLRQGVPVTYDFIALAGGTVTSIYAPHLGDISDDSAPEVLRFKVYYLDGDAVTEIASASLTADLNRAHHPLGDAYDITLDAPMTVTKGDTYRFEVVLDQGTQVVSGGSIVAWEGDWDDALPVKTCMPSDGLTLADNPPPGRFSATACNGRDAYWGLLGGGYKLQMVNNDSDSNREHMLQLLGDADYVIISSNRFYDSMTRNAMRWPMTTRYYQSLFDGELGYDLAAVFNRAFRLGPLDVPDNYLPFFNAPAWLNEFEAEEAFHVYDHPAVIVMHRGERYADTTARAILESVPLVQANAASLPYNVCASPDAPECHCPETPSALYCDPTLYDQDNITSLQASTAPTYLQLTVEARTVQNAGGTWADRFDVTSAINTQPVLTVIVWWLLMIAFGWAAFPLLFAVFPALADRGYGVAKAAGLLLTAWAAWYVASLHQPVWNRGGVLAALVGLAALSLLVVWGRRAEFVGYLRRRWRLLLSIEAITLVCFVAFLGVRLTNPDLWHFNFGGEKPMDFAYFNAVLRSSIFPPYDPWYAGGYINYYYFGYVIVGAPTLLLGVVPAVAYNLAIPSLFAISGISAFSVAYSLVDGWRIWKRPTPRPASDNGEQPQDAAAERQATSVPPVDPLQRAVTPSRRWANPFLAGMAALLLAVVLGNMDTPRTFFSGLATLGGYQPPQGLTQFLTNEATAAAEEGESVDYAAVQERAANPNPLDSLRYELNNTWNIVSSVATGFGRWVGGAVLPLAPHRWYWAPTRILGEIPGVQDSAIAEMPFFTFLYGDLHAHMIAMPLQFLAMAFLLNEVLTARSGLRSRRQLFLALAIGGITVGMMLATNSWDWITYTILGAVGLGFAWWLRWERISRWSLLALLATVGGFITLSWLAVLPFTTWYASVYTSALAWTGARSPLWAYISIYGAFLFLIAGLLFWDTGRWLREVRVSALRDTFPLVVGGVLVIGAILLGTVVATLSGYQVALIAVPLIVWIAVLFFREGQSRAMQFWLALAGLALALTLGVEFIVISGDIGRQNTVFKFYIQAWLLLSVVGGAAFAWLWASRPRWNASLRTLWMSAVVLLGVVGVLYTVMATEGRAQDRFSQAVPLTLDGQAYIEYAIHPENGQFIELKPDLGIIRWMNQNIDGLPVIMEAISNDGILYKWGGRISINTGLPAVIGWDWHQKQQRGLFNMPGFIEQRVGNVNAFYSTTDIPTAERIMNFYNVGYIVVGTLEHLYYPPESLEKFETMVQMGLLEQVYTEGDAIIYHVIHTNSLQVAMNTAN